MTKRLPFTEHSVIRAMRAVERAGLHVVGFRVRDGVLLVSPTPFDVGSLAAAPPETQNPPSPKRRIGEKTHGGQSPERKTGDYLKPASKWDDGQSLSQRTRSERLGATPREIPNADNPLDVAFDRFLRGEITLDQLPPGKYSNGMRVYADGEWEAIVRNRPMGKRELASLKAYFDADGSPNFRDGGPDTNERLQIRGLIEISDEPPEGRVPSYRITAAGKVEWQRLASK